jgi:hypothetical protein
MKHMIRSLAFAVVAVAATQALTAGTAHALPIVYSAELSGPAEAPPNASPGTGFTFVTIDTEAHTLRVQVSFSGLTGNTTAAHIHCCTALPGVGTAGVATTTPSFVGFPLGVTSGSMDQTYDLTQSSSYRPQFLADNGGLPASAELALAEGLSAGRAYFNIHTTTFGGGEIRGFLAPVPVPATIALFGAALAGLVATRRRAFA